MAINGSIRVFCCYDSSLDGIDEHGPRITNILLVDARWGGGTFVRSSIFLNAIFSASIWIVVLQWRHVQNCILLVFNLLHSNK